MGYNPGMTDTTLPCLTLFDETSTVRLGRTLAEILRPGDILALRGDLGAGKTALSRALIRAALNSPDEDVPSPTFTLVQVYDTPQGNYWHFDLYRLEKADDALELGIEDAFAEGISLIEWPDKLGSWLPQHALMLSLSITTGGTRHAHFSGPAHWASRLAGLDR